MLVSEMNVLAQTGGGGLRKCNESLLPKGPILPASRGDLSQERQGRSLSAGAMECLGGFQSFRCQLLRALEPSLMQEDTGRAQADDAKILLGICNP